MKVLVYSYILLTFVNMLLWLSGLRQRRIQVAERRWTLLGYMTVLVNRRFHIRCVVWRVTAKETISLPVISMITTSTYERVLVNPSRSQRLLSLATQRSTTHSECGNITQRKHAMTSEKQSMSSPQGCCRLIHVPQHALQHRARKDKLFSTSHRIYGG